MSWTPLEVILILFVWFPVAIPMILTPYFLTIFSVNVLGAGSFAAVTVSEENHGWLWFALMVMVFAFVVVGGIVLLIATHPVY